MDNPPTPTPEKKRPASSIFILAAANWIRAPQVKIKPRMMMARLRPAQSANVPIYSMCAVQTRMSNGHRVTCYRLGSESLPTYLPEGMEPTIHPRAKTAVIHPCNSATQPGSCAPSVGAWGQWKCLRKPTMAKVPPLPPISRLDDIT